MEKSEGVEYITDGKYHLICKPFTLINLHRMARVLNIDRCHFEYSKHGRLPHYDIPRKRKQEIEAQCEFVAWRDIVTIIKSSPDYIKQQNAIKVKQNKSNESIEKR